jgi:hypothetical protein
MESGAFWRLIVSFEGQELQMISHAFEVSFCLERSLEIFREAFALEPELGLEGLRSLFEAHGRQYLARRSMRSDQELG